MLLQLVHQRLTLQAAILTTELVDLTVVGSRNWPQEALPLKCVLQKTSAEVLDKTRAEALTVFMGPSWRLS